MRRVLVIVMMAVLAGMLAGCGGSTKKEADTERWNSYISVSNFQSGLYRSLEAYLTAYGDGKEPVQPRNNASFLNSMMGGPMAKERFTTAVRRANELSGKGASELDKSAMKMCAQIDELWNALYDAADYYRSKGYIDDGYAKGKKLHSKIIGMYPAFDDTAAEFNGLMDAKAKVLRKDEIKELKADGFKVRAAMLGALDAAKNLQDILIEQDISSENLQSLKMDVFRPAYDELVRAIEEFEKVSANDAQLKKEDVEKYSVTNVGGGLKGVKAAAAGLIERYQQGKNAPGGAPGMIAGTPENFDQRMSTLVTRYNQAIGVR